jgi:hypothetical protein
LCTVAHRARYDSDMFPSIVALDVNPGGRTTPDGHLGVAEIVGDEVVGHFEVRFDHPIARLHDGRPGEVGEFRAAWTFVEAFIGGRPVAVSNGCYDSPALAKLLVAAGLPAPPGLSLWCTKLIWRSLRPGVLIDNVWAAARRLGMIELAEQVRLLDAARSGSPPVSTAAQDDALMCALMLLGLARDNGCSAGELLAGAVPRVLSAEAAFRPRVVRPTRTVGRRLDPRRLP